MFHSACSYQFNAVDNLRISVVEFVCIKYAKGS